MFFFFFFFFFSFLGLGILIVVCTEYTLWAIFKCRCSLPLTSRPRRRPASIRLEMEPPNASRPFAPAPANGNGRQSKRRNPPQRENASSACSQCKLRKQKVHTLLSSHKYSNICAKESNDVLYNIFEQPSVEEVHPVTIVLNRETPTVSLMKQPICVEKRV